MKILVTGGNSRLSKKLKEVDENIFLTPGKDELNLLDKKSIINFYENNKDIDGIIFNAAINNGDLMSSPEDWQNDNKINELVDIFKLNHVSTSLLIHLYKDTLKFGIGLSTGLINHNEKNQCCPPYVLGKEILKNTVERFSYTDHLKHIKLFSINPGPMFDDEGYLKHANILYKIIKNVDKVESGTFGWILDSKFNYED
jgi:hypothetical protein